MMRITPIVKPARGLKLVNFLAVILLSACSSPIPETSVPAINNTAPEGTAAIPTESGAWQTYHSSTAGYSTEYPADWTVSEQVGADGSIVTTFSPDAGGTGIMLIVQSGEFGGAGSSDLPNTRCEEVSVGGVTGLRCFDTINFATSTTVVANGQTFTIAPLGKRMDEGVYSRFLFSFQFIK